MKSAFRKLTEFIKTIRKELAVYRLILKDERTPVFPKLLIGAAVVYLLLPFDFIPDFIPFFGQLDDIIIIPALIYTAKRFIPETIFEENRKKIYGFC